MAVIIMLSIPNQTAEFSQPWSNGLIPIHPFHTELSLAFPFPKAKLATSSEAATTSRGHVILSIARTPAKWITTPTAFAEKQRQKTQRDSHVL